MKRENIEKCRRLRRDQTEAEKKLWSVLRNRELAGGKFRRQFSIGSYILDFYSPENKLCIEADGGQHYEDNGRERDEIRTKELAKLGIELLRLNDGLVKSHIPYVVHASTKPVLSEPSTLRQACAE